MMYTGRNRYRDTGKTIDSHVATNLKLSGDGRHVSLSGKRHLQRCSHDQLNDSRKPTKRSRAKGNRSTRPCSSSNNTTETSSSECSVRMSRVKATDEKISLSTPVLQRPLRRTSRVSGNLSGCDMLSGSENEDLINLQAGEKEERLIDVGEDQGIIVTASKSFSSSSGRDSVDQGCELDMFGLDVRKSSSWSSSVDRSMADLNSYSTICDSFLEERPVTAKAKSASIMKSQMGMDLPADRKENVNGNELMIFGGGKDKNELLAAENKPLGELSMSDVLEFLTDTMEDVKLWIHEVPEDCRKRIGQCEAFLSYLCAKLYKDRDILVAPNIFSFVLWNVLKEYGSPNEYDLSLLAEAFTSARSQQKDLQWRHHSVSDIAKNLPMTLSCQKKDCFAHASKSLSDMQQDKNVKNTKNVKFKKRVTEKLTNDPRFQHLQKGPNVVQKFKANKKAHPLEQIENDVPPDVFHSLSLESLSDALANTQPRKATAVLPSQEHVAVYPNTTKTEEKLPTAEEMSSFLSSEIPVKPSPSKISRGRKEVIVEHQNYGDDGIRTPVSDACDILYKTAKRNLRRMVDFALTEFFTQSPSMTCCFVSAKGPLLVHEALFGAQCNNWNTIRRNGRKRAGMNGNHLIVDLRPDSIQHAGLWTVIEFVYTGSFTVTADNVFESQKAAEYFGVPSITDACLRLLNCLTSSKMVCYTIESLRRLQKEKHPLWTLALGKLVVCFDECRNDRIMVRWPLEVILPILEQSELYTKDEVNVYNFVVRWIEADFPRRRSLVPQIMNTVRFAAMNGDTLLFISSHAKILDGHPVLRQEIADLHLKIRMEDNGFDIPAEMDWSIPRRSKRSPNAARAYAHSGGDLNVLMLYFCPREFPENVKNEHFLKEDAAVILQRYTKICQNFLLVTDDGRFAGRWIYYGLTPLQMRDLASERRKLVRTADPFDRSSDILEGPVGVGGDGETIDTTDDTETNLYNLPAGTKLDNLLNYLKTPPPPKPKIRSTPSKPRPPTIYEDRVAEQSASIQRIVKETDNVFDREELPVQSKLPPGLIGELRHQRSMCSADSKDMAKITAMRKELWSRISGTACPAPVPCVPTTVRKTVSNIERTTESSRVEVEDAEGSVVERTESSLTFVVAQPTDTNVTRTEELQEQDNSALNNVSSDDEPENTRKKWYVELAERMNVFAATNPGYEPVNGVSPSASSVNLRTEEIHNPFQ